LAYGEKMKFIPKSKDKCFKCCNYDSAKKVYGMICFECKIYWPDRFEKRKKINGKK